jgi:hypothetical protein
MKANPKRRKRKRKKKRKEKRKQEQTNKEYLKYRNERSHVNILIDYKFISRSLAD